MTEDLLAHPPSNELQLILTEIFLGFQLTYLLSSYLALRGYSLKWFPIKERHFTGFWIIWLGLGLAISQVLGTSYLTLSMLFAGVILVTVLSPVLAVSIFLSVFLLRPWELVVRPSEIMNFIPKVLAVTCLGSCILHAAFRYSKRITWNLPLLLFSALFVCLFGSACFSGDIKGGLDYLFRHFYPIVVIMLLVTNLLENDKALKIVGTSIALSVCGVVITAFAETFFGPFNTAYEYRLHTSSFWGNPNDLGALILMALPFVVFPMILRAKSMEQLFIGLGMACTLLAGLVSTQSRGALLACFLACVVYLITGKGKRIILLSVGSLFVAAALGFVVMSRDSDDRGTSDVSRLTYAIAGFNMLKARPLFGVGIGNYPDEYNNYSPEFYEWGQRNAHSSWVLIMAEGGVLSLIVFILLFATTWSRAWRIKKQYPEYLIALVGYGCCMSLLAHTYTFPPYLLIALIIAAFKVSGQGTRPIPASSQQVSPDAALSH